MNDTASAEEPDVVALLARLDPDEAERTYRAAVARRKREAEEHRRAALRRVHREIYPELGVTAAAAEIAAAARGDRLAIVDSDEGRYRAGCRPAARQRLEELASDLLVLQLGPSRIKQLLAAQK